MRDAEGKLQNPKARGVSLIAAIFIIVVLAFMGVMFLSMISTSTLTSVNDMQSAQALAVAEGGGEYARMQFEQGTVCGSLNYNNIALGQGTFTTSGQRFGPVNSNLTSAITNVDTVIPVASIAGFAPQGRIRVENEEIVYAATSIVAANCAPYGQPCFTDARRGVAGTAAAAHALLDTYGVAVPSLQDMCTINSAGTVASAKRSVVVEVPGYASAAVSAYLDGQPTLIRSAAMTKIGSLKTELAAGDNLIIVVVAFQNTSGVNASINANSFQLRRGATILAANLSLIHVVGTINPAAGDFPQETQFLLYKDTGAASYPTYDIVAQATANNRISARVKMVVLNNVPNSDFFSGANTWLSNPANLMGAAGHQFTLPNATNVILAAVQLDNTTGNNRTINQNGLAIRRGGTNGTVLASNAIAIGIEQNNSAREGVGLLMIARDTTPGGANPTYSVTANGNNNIRGQARVLILSGLQSAFYTSGLINPLPTALTSYNFATGFPAGDNIIISASQYYNNEAGTRRNILADQMVYGGVISANTTPIYLGTGAEVDDYTTGLLLHHTAAPANATYRWQSLASGGAQVWADTDMAAIHLNINTIPLFGWRETFP